MSFHIAAQSVTNPRLGLTVNFKQNDADTSKVILEIASSGITDLDEDGNPDGEARPAHVLQLCFNRGGLLLWQKVTDPDGNDFHQHITQNEIRDPSGAALPAGYPGANPSLGNPGNNPYAMIHQPVTDRTRPRPNEGTPNTENRDLRDETGRNPSADNPYEYKAPVDPDAAQRGDVNVGGVQPYPTAERRTPDAPPDPHEVRKEAMDNAAKAAEDAKAKRAEDAKNAPVGSTAAADAQAERDAPMEPHDDADGNVPAGQPIREYAGGKPVQRTPTAG